MQVGRGIYLRCGRLWRETLALNAQQLVDGSVIAGYGPECASNSAVISAADSLVGGWTKSGNVWSRDLPAGTPKISQMFFAGQALQIAQWPNSNASAALASINSGAAAQLLLQGNEATTLQGKDLVGATVQVRTQSWFIENRVVTGSSASTIDLGQALRWTPATRTAFVLQDKRWMLDSPGEFFHDTAAQKLYLIAPPAVGAGDINSALIEGSTRDVALSLSQRSGLVVRDLALRAARSDGLHLWDTPRAQISRIEASDNALNGVRLEQWQPLASNVLGPTLSDSVIYGNGQYGIKAQDAVRAVISKNQVVATGNGAQHQATVIAAIAGGPGAQVLDNVVDGSGYLGISFSARDGSLTARNTISGYCSRLADCGAIYTWQGRAQAGAAQAAVVENNRVLPPALAPASSSPVVGIYLDDFTRNVVVRGNLLNEVPSAILLHNATDITVENNRIWWPSQVALWVSMDQTDADWSTGNVLRNNEIVPSLQASANNGTLPSFNTAYAIWFWHSLSGEAAVGGARNAFYGNRVLQWNGPLAAHAQLRGPGSERDLDALEWLALNPSELLPLRYARFDPLVLSLGPEKVLRGGFDLGLDTWSSYRNPVGNGFTLSALPSLYGCVASCVSLTAGHGSDLLASDSFNLSTGAPHVYRWTAAMPAISGAKVGQPYISRAASPWDPISDSQGHVTYGPRRGAANEVLDYQSFFIAKTSDAARVNLQLESLGLPVAFDNVSVREVTGYRVAQASEWRGSVTAPADTALTVSCGSFGWPVNCLAMGIDGQALAMPLLVPAGSSKLVLRADSPLRR
jgi:Right handed beta helix region